MKTIKRFSRRALSPLLAALCAVLLPWAAVPAETAAYAKLLMDRVAGDIPLFADESYSIV